jgi:hypothetical protein
MGDSEEPKIVISVKLTEQKVREILAAYINTIPRVQKLGFEASPKDINWIMKNLGDQYDADLVFDGADINF